MERDLFKNQRFRYNLKLLRVVMSEERQSVVTGRNRDCLACKLVSGSGLIGAGIYVAYHSKRFNKNTGKTVMFSIATVLVGLGAARILEFPPFDNSFRHG